MTREILFRGKRIDNGEWVEGWYHSVTKGAWLNPIQNGHYITTFKKLDNGEMILTECFEVDHATVGQYTGALDKNGKKIFEGDIVNITNLAPHETWEYREVVGVVRVCGGAFEVEGKENEDYTPYCWIHDTAQAYSTVIGNIHDNPELLEAKPCTE